jgi:hypothetical protein
MSTPPSIMPAACSPEYGSCRSDSDCCSGLECLGGYNGKCVKKQ